MTKILNDAVKEFFEILDTEDESENGVVFHPVHISSVRGHLTSRLEKCLEIMKGEVNNG